MQLLIAIHQYNQIYPGVGVEAEVGEHQEEAEVGDHGVAQHQVRAVAGKVVVVVINLEIVFVASSMKG